MTRGRRLCACCLTIAFLPGCGTVGLSLDELPMDPIAVTYWQGENARRRAELLSEESKTRQQKLGVAHPDSIRRFLGMTGEPDQLSRFPGRLSLVNPVTLEVTPIAQAPRGSLPLAWSEDHDRLLFLSNHKRRIQVYEYSRSAGVVRTITYGEHPHLFADYGLGEQLVLLQVVTEGKRQFERIFVTDAEGGSPRLLFENRIVEPDRDSNRPTGRHGRSNRVDPPGIVPGYGGTGSMYSAGNPGRPKQ